MKLLYIVLFTIISTILALPQKPMDILTESMKKGVKKLGEHCMKTVGATMEEMNSIRHGPPYKGKAACAIACILDKAGIMSDKKFSKKGFVNAVKPFLLTDPKKMSHMKEIANACEKEATTKMDECETADYIIRCLKTHIPEIEEFKFN